MSRSKRKNLIVGIAGRSEKKDKKLWHKKWRTKTRQALKLENYEEVDSLSDERTVSNPWSMSKDGKHYIGNHKNHNDFRKWIKK